MFKFKLKYGQIKPVFNPYLGITIHKHSNTEGLGEGGT